MPPQQQQDQRDLAPWEMAQPPAEQPPPPPRDVPPWELAQPPLGTRTIGDYQQLPQADIGTPSGAGQFGIGVLKSVPQTIHGAAAITHLAPQGVLDIVQRLATPTTPEQVIGKATGQALQFLALPGGTGLIPAGERILGAGALNALQSDDPTWKDFALGAGMGAGGEVLGMGLRKMAPGMAESATGISKGERTYGKTPGIAALEETRGFTPTAVEQSARTRINQLNTDVNNMAAQHPGTIDLRPALNEIRADIQRARSQNNQPAVDQLLEVRQNLMTDTRGNPIAPDQPATNALELKRGLRKQWVSNWTNPALMKGTRATAANAAAAIDRELDAALGPDFTSKNQTVSSLIPIEERAESTARGAGIGQNIMHRIAAHTGALTGMVGGGITGYRERGLPGAIAGSTIGLVAPELISSPAARMAAARLFYSPVIPRLVSGATGAGLQASRAIDTGQ